MPRLSNRISRENAARRLQEAREGRLGPEVLEVRDPAHDEDEIDGAAADDLVGDVDVAAARVVRLGNGMSADAGRGRHDRGPEWRTGAGVSSVTGAMKR